MATRYLEIIAVQRPFQYMTDDNGRSLFSCNFNAVAAAPVSAFEEEIAKLVSQAGGGTIGSTLLVGMRGKIPETDGPITLVLDSGGTAPMETHDGAKYERLSFQVIVRSKSYTAGRDLALTIWRALDGQRNVTVAA